VVSTLSGASLAWRWPPAVRTPTAVAGPATDRPPRSVPGLPESLPSASTSELPFARHRSPGRAVQRDAWGDRPKEVWDLDLIVIIVLVVLLLAALGPRAGWYGAANVIWDILALIIFIALVVWLLRLLGVLVF
jgi:hypothetical protein